MGEGTPPTDLFCPRDADLGRDANNDTLYMGSRFSFPIHLRPPSSWCGPHTVYGRGVFTGSLVGANQ